MLKEGKLQTNFSNTNPKENNQLIESCNMQRVKHPGKRSLFQEWKVCLTFENQYYLAH